MIGLLKRKGGSPHSGISSQPATQAPPLATATFEAWELSSPEHEPQLSNGKRELQTPTFPGVSLVSSLVKPGDARRTVVTATSLPTGSLSWETPWELIVEASPLRIWNRDPENWRLRHGYHSLSVMKSSAVLYGLEPPAGSCGCHTGRCDRCRLSYDCGLLLHNAQSGNRRRRDRSAPRLLAKASPTPRLITCYRREFPVLPSETILTKQAFPTAPWSPWPVRPPTPSKSRTGAASHLVRASKETQDDTDGLIATMTPAWGDLLLASQPSPPDNPVRPDRGPADGDLNDDEAVFLD